ncbi:MAG: type II secretion system protein [Candidatus Paceibacterota bacterium]|jgi:prepilin-type N-terminal cleavage/methylation domain-containing protein
MNKLIKKQGFNQHQTSSKKKFGAGFTLIELLVVVAIIGILSSIVLTSLNKARSKGRDARRNSDIHQIQNALAMYYDINGQYPLSGNCGSTAPATWWSNSVQCLTSDGHWIKDNGSLLNNLNLSESFPTKDPIDPINKNPPVFSGGNATNAYYYFSQGGYGGAPRSWYMIVYKLENINQTLAANKVIAPDGTVFQYSVTNNDNTFVTVGVTN